MCACKQWQWDDDDDDDKIGSFTLKVRLTLSTKHRWRKHSFHLSTSVPLATKK